MIINICWIILSIIVISLVILICYIQYINLTEFYGFKFFDKTKKKIYAKRQKKFCDKQRRILAENEVIIDRIIKEENNNGKNSY